METDADQFLQLFSIWEKWLELHGDSKDEREWELYQESQLGNVKRRSDDCFNLLSRDTWPELIKQYLSLNFTKQSFKTSNFREAANQHLDEFWVQYFTTIHRQTTELFPDMNYLYLDKESMSLLIGIGKFSRNKEWLRKAFWPQQDDSAIANHFRPRFEWFEHQERFHQYKLHSSVNDEIRRYDSPECDIDLFRRPGFLNFLDAHEYISLYNSLASETGRIHDPASLAHAIDLAGTYLTPIAQNILFFADDSRKTTDDNFPPPRDSPSIVQEIGLAHSPRDQDMCPEVVHCLMELFNHVSEHESSWSKLPRCLTIVPEYMFGLTFPEEFHLHFTDKFFSYPWSFALDIIIKHLGTAAFVGVMDVWKRNSQWHYQPGNQIRQGSLDLSIFQRSMLSYLPSHNSPFPLDYESYSSHAVEQAYLAEQLRFLHTLLTIISTIENKVKCFQDKADRFALEHHRVTVQYYPKDLPEEEFTKQELEILAWVAGDIEAFQHSITSYLPGLHDRYDTFNPAFIKYTDPAKLPIGQILAALPPKPNHAPRRTGRVALREREEKRVQAKRKRDETNLDEDEA